MLVVVQNYTYYTPLHWSISMSEQPIEQPLSKLISIQFHWDCGRTWKTLRLTNWESWQTYNLSHCQTYTEEPVLPQQKSQLLEPASSHNNLYFWPTFCSEVFRSLPRHLYAQHLIVGVACGCGFWRSLKGGSLAWGRLRETNSKVQLVLEYLYLVSAL